VLKSQLESAQRRRNNRLSEGRQTDDGTIDVCDERKVVFVDADTVVDAPRQVKAMVNTIVGYKVKSGKRKTFDCNLTTDGSLKIDTTPLRNFSGKKKIL
jgi:hypothetical protein